jgi:hypothetical protein
MGSMKLRLQLRFRAIGTAIAGFVLLLESVNSEFLRHHIEAWSTLVNLFIALFGAAFLIQACVIVKRLQAGDTMQTGSLDEFPMKSRVAPASRQP